MKTKAIIFDFDGTIADTFSVTLKITEDITNHHRKLSKQEIQHFRQLSPSQIARELCIPLWRVPFLLQRGRLLMRQQINNLKPFEGMVQAVAKLHGQGFNLLIMSSNSQRNIQTFLDQHDLAAYFSGVHGSVGLFGKKQALQNLMRHYKWTPEMVFYVGDELRDIAGAQAAGVRMVSVGWGYNDPARLKERKPFALVMTPAALPKVFWPYAKS